MRHSLTFIFLSFCLQLTAQTDKEKLVGDWKLYLKDKISFEFLRLNSDGTGLKCFGQTINGNDTLFLSHITTLQIKRWKVTKTRLILENNNTVSFEINPEYKLTFLENDKIELDGEHLIFYLYPSLLNRKEFQRSVTYQRAEKIPKDYGVNSASCIVEDRHLFTLNQVDNATQLAAYKGFDDLIPYIVSCNNGYEYVQKYHDSPYSLEIPSSIHKWSFGFGNKSFYISFNSEDSDTSETSIVIYYDFDNKMKDYYFSQIQKGKEKKELIKQNSLDIYKTMNWQGKYEGKVFLDNSIVVAYYTRDKKFQEKLQKCIASFKYN
jgi:hypothetical protein